MSIEKIRNIGLDKLVTQVYDFDSLTTDELLCKFAQKINIIIEHLKYIDDRSYNSDKALEEKLQYLLGQGLEEQTAKRLLELINDGTIGNLINETLLKEINEQLEDITLNVKDFGAKGDSSRWRDFNPITGTDDTIAIQNAINKAIETGGKLTLEKNKNYRITDTLEINGYIELEGNWSRITSDIDVKTKPLFKISNSSGSLLKNLKLSGNALCKCAIQFSSPNSQKVELRNIRMSFFRYGIFSDERTTCDRLIVNQCEIENNIISGIYLDGTLGGSAPLKIIDSLIVGNGVHKSWIGRKQNGILAIEDEFIDTYQVFLKNIVMNIFSGQISGALPSLTHEKYINRNLVRAELSSALTIIGTDFEQSTLSGREKGVEPSSYSDLTGTEYGGAIHIEDSTCITIENISCWEIHGNAIIKLVNCSQKARLDNITCGSDKCTFAIDVIRSNENYMTEGGSSVLFLETNELIRRLSPAAILATDKRKFTLLTSISGGVTPNNLNDYIFTKSTMQPIRGGMYTVGGLGEEANPNFEKGCYIEKKVNNPSAIIFNMYATKLNGSEIGRAFVECLDKNDNRLSAEILRTATNHTYGNRYYKNWVVYCPKNTAKIRYGFINIGTEQGAIGNNQTVDINGFRVYCDSYSPIMIDDVDNIDNINFMKNIHTIKNWISVGDGWANDGKYHKKGEIIFNTNPYEGSPIGWRCTESGTPGTWKSFQ